MRTSRCTFTVRLAGFAVLTIALLVLWITASLAQNATEDTARDKQYGLILAKQIDSGIQDSAVETFVAPLVAADVTIDVTGVISRTRITQVFVNPNDNWLEGVYIFPLPSEAAVDLLTMTSEGRLIVGEIQPRQIAKQTYDTAKQAGFRTSLLEQERPNIFTASVAQIPPRGTVEISIAYQEALTPEAGVYSLRFPMVAAPRYIPVQHQVSGVEKVGWSSSTLDVPDAARITPPVLHPDTGRSNPLKLTVKLETGTQLIDIKSPTHAIHTWRTETDPDRSELGPTATMVTLSDSVTFADRDFVLEWSPDVKTEPEVSLFREDRPDGTYLLAVVNPPRKAPQTSNRHREMIIVLDRSGSMAGESITQARRAVERALRALTPTDSLNVFAFNDQLQPLFPMARSADPRTIKQALKFMRALGAEGGTEAQAALMAALDGRHSDTRLRQVVFITDGAVGNEAALEALIKARLGDSRLFTVGIGSAPNSFLMRRAAEVGRGTHTFINSIRDVEHHMDRLLQKLAAPVATDFNVDVSGADQGVILWPRVLPDLYWGEPISLTAKLQSMDTHIALSAQIDNAPWVARLDLANAITAPGVAKAWARNKIKALDQSRLDGVDPKVIETGITETGLRFGLVTKHTSLVAVDKTPIRNGDTAMATAPVPVNLPAGWHYEAVFGARGGTDAAMRFRLGIAALLVALTIRSIVWKRGRT